MSYAEKGYKIYKDFFLEEELTKWEDTLRSVFHYQALKLGFDSANIDDLVRYFESKSKDAGYQCALQAENTLGAKRFASLPNMANLYLETLDTAFITIVGPLLLTNIPSSKRLIYRWHTERHFYPKRTRFANIWIPTFRNKRDGAGTLILAENTHKKHWDFVEYSGYDEENVGDKQAYTQYETVIDEPLKEITLELDRKDLVIFDGNLVHKSTINHSNNVTYATSVRVYDTSKDPTLSGDIRVQPFKGNDLGYPGLKL